MSQVIRATCQVTDLGTLQRTCTRLNYPAPRYVENYRVGAGLAATGSAVKLPEWQKLAVFDLAKGEVAYDNYEGRWGDIRTLERFQQEYLAQQMYDGAAVQGYSVQASELENGELELLITV